MRLAKFRGHGGHCGVGLLESDISLRVLPGVQTLAEILHADNPEAAVRVRLDMSQETYEFPARVMLESPIDAQEVWAAGVTYLRSKTARESESPTAASCYDRVYTAPRPELFFKATARRVVGPEGQVRARVDSKWSVPEPELALVISPVGRIVGYTLGNDMSSRDIEGENPLYLPQAKLYKQSCAVGPCITLAQHMPAKEQIEISMTIRRGDQLAFQGATSFGRFVRRPEELVEWLFRDNDFPDGVILLTGTGVVPPDDFTLHNGDMLEMSATGIGTLQNRVVIGE